ncbi:hypothetical protein [Ascidiimonas sp. W6]|uniref:hypothetical protein n=1 Tax=Ascidiimonas meishanensis TaxID=3128903 RepID=UPI0030EB7AB4
MINFFDKSLEYSLQQLLASKNGVGFLQSLNEAKIYELSKELVSKNWFNDAHLLEAAISNIWPNGSVVGFVSHVIWCAHREALSKSVSGKGESEIPMVVNGLNHLDAIENKPAVIITPMTLATIDAVTVITKLSSKLDNAKDFIIYGENMDPYFDVYPKLRPLFAENNLSGIKTIKKVLRNNGLFFTYADFVYDTHSNMEGNLFGIKRVYSQGFLSITASSKAVLLPMLLLKKQDTIEVNLYSAIQQGATSSQNQLSKNMQTQILCIVVGKILEGLIVKATNQWRLLPTLSHEVEFSI